MIRRAITASVTTAVAVVVALGFGSGVGAAGGAPSIGRTGVECFRAPCPHLPLVVETTAPYVFGKYGYQARGWQCHHVARRVWQCVRQPAQHRG